MPGTTTKRSKDGRKRMLHGIHINRNRSGEFYFVVVAKNGHVLVKSSESYKTKQSAKKAISSVYEVLGHFYEYHSGTFEVHDHTVTQKVVGKKIPKKA